MSMLYMSHVPAQHTTRFFLRAANQGDKCQLWRVFHNAVYPSEWTVVRICWNLSYLWKGRKSLTIACDVWCCSSQRMTLSALIRKASGRISGEVKVQVWCGLAKIAKFSKDYSVSWEQLPTCGEWNESYLAKEGKYWFCKWWLWLECVCLPPTVITSHRTKSYILRKEFFLCISVWAFLPFPEAC